MRRTFEDEFYFYFQRNGHWMGDSHMGNNEGYNASDSSQRGSQAALLAVNNDRHRWPKGKDFLFSTWAFVVGKKIFHSTCNSTKHHYILKMIS